MKKIYFLSGLARSGSTLLGSILNQHPEIYVSPTSPVADIIFSLEKSVREAHVRYTFDFDKVFANQSKAILYASYDHIEKPIIFDKHRGWPRNRAIAQTCIENDFKGIITYRPTPEIIVSFIKLFNKDPNNWIDNTLRKEGRPINNRNRADYLWRYYMQDPHNSVAYGLQHHPDKLLPLSYDQIVLDTKNSLQKIENFFGISGIKDLHLDSIENTCAESKDESWGVKDLHTIRPMINKTSDDAVEVLGKELFDYYSKFDFKL